ncbi:MAG TPA: substrate-binding domain-containing protein [Streptosporangiaceae bacterium]|jgi:simple sugar transport system substrate-binding protein|nr:substrate-binding domain-containing protein [Streptosporangiaceae bacterium]
MRKKIDPVVDEAIETLNMKDGPSRRRLLEGAGLFSATAAASALIAACSSSSSSSASTAKAAAGNFPTTPKWQFTFVNHVTDNSFFTPTQYGFADAAAILGIPTPHWTGALSTQPTVPTMLSAFNDAVTAGSPGIATTVVAATSFISPINSAKAAGVPVVTYNANGSSSSPTNGLAYIGQDLLASGTEVGTRLASLMKKGDTAVGIIAQPGALNIQPRLDGAAAALQAAGITVLFGNKGFDAGASASAEATALPEFVQSHGSKIQGIFAVDGGDTALLGSTLQKYGLVGKVAAGGFDLEPQTLTAISAGQISFTVDQSPYLQGFLPTIYLYLWQLSGGLVNPATTDTGLKFVTKSNAGAYTTPATRFEGSTSAQKYEKHSGAIST